MGPWVDEFALAFRVACLLHLHCGTRSAQEDLSFLNVILILVCPLIACDSTRASSGTCSTCRMQHQLVSHQSSFESRHLQQLGLPRLYLMLPAILARRPHYSLQTATCTQVWEE